MVVATVALASLACVASTTQAVPAPTAATRSAPATIRVATFNIQDGGEGGRAWKPRRKAVLAQFRRTRADVVVVQEGDAYGRGIARQPLEWLAKKTGYRMAPVQHEPSIDTDRDGYVGATYSPAIFYRPGRLAFEKNPYTWTTLHGDYPPWPHKSHRAAFVDRRTGQRLMVIGLHLSVGKAADVESRRADELAEVDAELAWARRHGLKAPPTIWAGDMNTLTPRGSPVRRHFRRHGLVDSWTVAKRRTHERLNTFNGLRRRAAASGRRIDQIWVPRGTRVKRWDQVADVRDGRYRGPFASDHNAVVATVVLPASR